MTTKRKQPKKPAGKAKRPTAKQRNNSGVPLGRDDKGRFIEGNPHSFQPGETGNPQGRPKRTRLTEALRDQLAEMMADAPEETIAEAIAKALITEALKGDVQAIREIGDRTEGRPKQAIDIDARLSDWRALAASSGLREQDVLDEARRLIESAAATSDAESD